MSKRKCSCYDHDKFFKDDSSAAKLVRRDAKKIKKEIIETLVKGGHLSERFTYLCASCCQHAENIIKVENEKKISLSDCFDKVIEGIEKDWFPEEKLASLSRVLGAAISEKVYKDTLEAGKFFKDEKCLENFNVSEWIQQRNPVVSCFISGIGGDKGQKLDVAKAIDAVYYVTNNSFVAPLAFGQNLINYFETGSKTGVKILSPGNPCGCYTTILNFVKDTQPVKVPTDGDLVTFFDNNQMVEKKWHVEANFKSKSSVVTSNIHITHASHLQEKLDLSPAMWYHPTPMDSSISELETYIETHQEMFITFRNQFVDDLIQKLLDETELVPHASNRYTFVTSGHHSNTLKPVVTMGEAVLENPCSRDSIQIVFDKLMSDVTTNSKRKWCILGCDGLPYNIGSRIIDDIHVCPIERCQREFDSKMDLEDHLDTFGHEADPLLCRKYANVLLLPGLGHFEINMTKALFKLLWDVCLSRLAKLLGFESPKAQLACQNATDHHKSWQIIQIFLFSFGGELLLPYISSCKRQHRLPTAEDYFLWAPHQTNMYKFMFQAVFTYCLSLHVFRAGVRRNNSVAINAARATFAPLFFSLNMPFYMEAFIRDSLVRIQCPPSVRGFIESHESYSISGNQCKGEGADFLLEAKNKSSKRLLPPGLPSDSTWIRSCRNVDRFDRVID